MKIFSSHPIGLVKTRGSSMLTIATGFRTAEGARSAAIRHARLESFLAEFMDESAVNLRSDCALIPLPCVCVNTENPL